MGVENKCGTDRKQVLPVLSLHNGFIGCNLNFAECHACLKYIFVGIMSKFRKFGLTIAGAFANLLILLPLVNGGFDANFTLQNVWGRLPEPGIDSLIHCFSSDGIPMKIKFRRTVDTGQGKDLPKYSKQFLHGDPVFSRILLLQSNDGLSWFGAYHCEVSNQGIATQIIALKRPHESSVEIDGKEINKVINSGESVELEMEVVKDKNLTIRWRHNGGPEISEWNDQLKVKLDNVQAADAGIYECYYKGRRNQSVHGIMRLIVRGCPAEKYGPLCDKDCPPCYNGGICHDMWGVCICPAGFTGVNCELACGANHFGADCSKLCSPPLNNSNMDQGCAVYVLCKPDPYGCSCAPGFKGKKCMDHCEPGMYGADCKQPCHCIHGPTTCNRITGACDGGCARGWRGDSCQIHDPSATPVPLIESTTPVLCPAGKYGHTCEKNCHCKGGAACDSLSGYCAEGCDPEWTNSSCDTCADGRFGDLCEFACHCDGGHSKCDSEGFCSNSCEAGWTGFTCQQQCAPGRFGKNCAFSCHCQDGNDACDEITGHCTGNCEPGFMDKDCQITCPYNFYGVNCANKCFCENGGHCNRVNGTCSCEGRWRGKQCSQNVPQIAAAQDEEVNTNQSAYISCTVDAIPPPVVQLTASSFPSLRSKVRELDGNQYQIVVTITPSSTGEIEFYCTAVNDYGSDSKKIILHTFDPPVLGEKPTILEVTSTTIKVTWKPWEYGINDGGKESDRVDYRVVYKKSEESDFLEIDNWKSDLSATVQNLEPYTSYDLAVKCRRPKKGGEGRPGPIITSRTLCGIPTPYAIPQEFIAVIIKPTSVKLSWKPPLYSELQCLLTGYKLRYRPATDILNYMYIEVSDDVEMYEVNCLTPNTEYVFNIFPVTIQDLGNYAELIISTLESVPGPVSDLTYESFIDSTLLSVRWMEPVVTHGAIKDYVVTYQLSNKSHCGMSSMEEKNVTSSTNQVTLMNLFPYSAYEITVQARTAAGTGEPKILHLVTKESVPNGVPQHVRVIMVNKTMLQFIWDHLKCEETNGRIISYEYGLQLASEVRNQHARKKRNNRIQWVISPTTIKRMNVTAVGLHPFMEYAFFVRANTKYGSGPFSKPVFQRTAEDVPAAPVLSVLDKSSNSLNVSWHQPYPLQGIVLQYELNYWMTLSNKSIVVVDKNKASFQERPAYYLIHGLKPFTLYSLEIRASTKVGWGEWSIQTETQTQESVPGPPKYVEATLISDNIISVIWQAPDEANGILIAYKVTCHAISSLLPIHDSSNLKPMEQIVNSNTYLITFKDVHPSTEYSISVSASTSVGYGEAAHNEFWTASQDIEYSTSYFMQTEDFEHSSFTIPFVFSTKNQDVLKYQVIVENGKNTEDIDATLLTDYHSAMKSETPYYITAELNASSLPEEDSYKFIVGDSAVYGSYPNVHLNQGVPYRIWIRTITRHDQKMKNVVSEPINAVYAAGLKSEEDENKALRMHYLHLIFITITSLGIVMILIFFIVMILRRSRKPKKVSVNSNSFQDSGISDSMTWSVAYKVSESEAADGPLVNDGQTNIAFQKTVSSSTMLKHYTTTSIALENLPEHIHKNNDHFYSNNGFLKEFQQIDQGQSASWAVGKKNVNVRKNRFGNILPYDHNRVILKPLSCIAHSDYINASYVDGYNKRKEYVLTQGPLDNTVLDFWRMIWQDNSVVIVMLTDLMENGKRKCVKYWPDDSRLCGDFHLLLIHNDTCKDFIIRTILINHLQTGETRRVHQYHFFDWSEQKVPYCASSLLAMQKRIYADNPDLVGPVTVHCCSGTGRSGTYVAIDILQQQAAEEKRVDVVGTVKKVQSQRINLVQSLDQYIFIYEAMLSLYCGNTAVPAVALASWLKNSYQSKLEYKTLEIRNQFQIFSKLRGKINVIECSEALDDSNILKNREFLIVPCNSTRLKLNIVKEVYSSDYINAIAVDGYKKKDLFLVTQTPLELTVEDFWRMVYDYHSSLIVMLNDPQDDDSTIGQYWSKEGYARYGIFQVDVITFENHGPVMIQIMKLTNILEPKETPRRVVHLQYTGWDYYKGLPSSPASMLALLNQVNHWQQRTEKGPTVVHCLNGATRCGLFCAAYNACQQIKSEGVVDIFQIARHLSRNRPEFLLYLEQFQFTFQVALEFTNSFSC